MKKKECSITKKKRVTGNSNSKDIKHEIQNDHG